MKNRKDVGPRCSKTKQDVDDLVTWHCCREENHRGRHHWTNPESLAKQLYNLLRPQ